MGRVIFAIALAAVKIFRITLSAKSTQTGGLTIRLGHYYDSRKVAWRFTFSLDGAAPI